MAKKDLKAYVRYDGSGRVIPGSLILNRFKPKVGNWKETNASLCCNFIGNPVCFRIIFGLPSLSYTLVDDIVITWKGLDGSNKTSVIPAGVAVNPISDFFLTYSISLPGISGSLSIDMGTNDPSKISYSLSENPSDICICNCMNLTWDPLTSGITTLGYFRCDGIFVDVDPSLGEVSDCMIFSIGSVYLTDPGKSFTISPINGGSCVIGDSCQ